MFKQWKEKYLVLTVEGSLLVCRDAESPPDQVVSLQTCCESVAEGREILDLPRLPPGGRRDCCFALILPQNKFLLLLSDSPDDCRCVPVLSPTPYQMFTLVNMTALLCPTSLCTVLAVNLNKLSFLYPQSLAATHQEGQRGESAVSLLHCDTKPPLVTQLTSDLLPLLFQGVMSPQTLQRQRSITPCITDRDPLPDSASDKDPGSPRVGEGTPPLTRVTERGGSFRDRSQIQGLSMKSLKT